MPTYCFSIQHGAAETEELGLMKLPDDAEALAFARRLVHDMNEDIIQRGDNDRSHCDGHAVAISAGTRAVGRVSCTVSAAPQIAAV